MQFLTSLIGGSENTFLTALLALGIVLLLIVFGLWLLKIFFRASNTFVRGRNRRLTVVDQVAIDNRRQLVIVRRDNVEHLILTGGPQDLVVESGIVAEKPGSVPRRPANPGSTAAAAAPVAQPALSQPVTDALEAARGLAHPAEQPERPIERLRDLSRAALRSGQPRNPTSLRHTGLMRPVSRMETAAVIPINPDNSDHRRVDSAKTGPQNHTTGQSGLGGGTYLGDGIKAEGN